MTGQELKQMAFGHLQGKNGYPKNEKKGWKLMQQAADAGDSEACGQIALHYMDAIKLPQARDYFNMVEAYKRHPNAYAKCLALYAAKKLKKEPDFVRKLFEEANRVENDLHGDGHYYYAVLLHFAYPDNEEKYCEHLYYAALGGSDDMPDSCYAYINRERGVLHSKAEMEAWLRVNNDGRIVGGFIPCKLDEEEAWRVAVSNLDTKAGRRAFIGAARKAFISKDHETNLEYQQVIKCQISVDTISARYEYNHPNSNYINKGAGKLDINSYWTNCYATYRAKQPQDELFKKYKDVKLSDDFVEARVRVNPYRSDEVICECKNQTIYDATIGTLGDIKTTLVKQNNWEKRYIHVDIDDYAQSLKNFYMLFVPFYFFTVKLGGKKTYTIRVNAFTGETDFFVNNPFGQFTDDDDVKKGGFAKIGQDKSKKDRKARRRRNIKLFYFLVLALLSIVAFSISAAFSQSIPKTICFILGGAFGLGALWNLIKVIKSR